MRDGVDQYLLPPCTSCFDLLPNEFSAITQPVILLIEFCETIGPRVVHQIPDNNTAPHANVDTIALWLSCTAHLPSAYASNEGRLNAIDVQLSAFNASHGVHAFAHHFNLFSLSARGFVRSFCLALLTPERNVLDCMRDAVAESLQSVVNRLRECNQCEFDHTLRHALKVFDGLAAESEELAVNNVPRRRHYSRAATSRLLEAMKEAKIEVRLNTLCHDFGVERETIVCDIVRVLLERECGAHCDKPQNFPTLDALAPCVSDGLLQEISLLWEQCCNCNPLTNVLSTTSDSVCADVRVDNLPILLSSSTGQNRQSVAEKSETLIEDNGVDLLVPLLTRSLAPLCVAHWTGQICVVSAQRQQRKSTAKRLLRCLSHLLVTHGSALSASHLCDMWHESDRLPPDVYCTFKLLGIGASASNCMQQNIQPYVAHINLDADLLRVKRQPTRLLDATVRALDAKKRVVDDNVIISSLHATAAHYALFAYTLSCLTQSSNEEKRNRSTRLLMSFIQPFKLKEGDMHILYYWLELAHASERWRHSDVTANDVAMLSWDVDTIFCDYMPSDSADVQPL